MKTNKGSRGRAPKKMTAQSRTGETRDTMRPVRGENKDSRRYGSVTKEQVRSAPPVVRAQPIQLKRVQLDVPPSETVFKDMDGQSITFPESNLRRVAARILSNAQKTWRYRAFPFPIFTDKSEQTLFFDFYVYDYEETIIRLILVVPHESREVWDKIGRFKRQYPMYTYELWTPEKMAALSRPRAKLGF